MKLKNLTLLLIFVIFIDLYAQSGKVDYLLGPGDLIDIKVWQHPDLDRTLRINENGTFQFPLIGTVIAKGKSVSELEKEIQERLGKDYIVNPYVTVVVKEYNSKKVSILGEVVSPGIYYLNKKSYLVDIIAKAGGISPKYNQSKQLKVLIKRENIEKEEPIIIDLYKLLVEGDMSLNVEIKPDDVIYVQAPENYYIFGEIKKPGAYPYDKGITLLKAIALAEGITERAQVNKIKIIRKVGNKDKIFIFNLKKALKGEIEDFNIKPMDILSLIHI